MALQRAAVLHTDNTVVDNSGTADIRRLTGSWTTYGITTIQNATQASNAERRWDPETAADVTNQNAATQCDGKGFAVPTADMATVDAACVPSLAAQNLTIDFSVNFFGTGQGAVGSTDIWTPRASLWKWNTSTDTATLIVGGSGTAVSRAVTFAYGPTLKTGQVVLAVPATTFGANEILLIVTGGNLACGAGLLGGARTFAVRLDQAASPIKLTFATSGLLQACSLSSDMVGAGVLSRSFDVGMSDDLVGAGVLTQTHPVVATKTSDLVGAGVLTETHPVVATKTADVVGAGVLTPSGLDVGLSRSVTGDGTLSATKAVVATKSASIVGDGVVTASKEIVMSDDLTGAGVLSETHPLQATRSADMTGSGTVFGTIEIPLDEVPEGGGGTTIRRPTYIFDD